MDETKIRFEARPEFGYLYFRTASEELEQSMRAALHAEGVETARVAEFSSGAGTVLTAVISSAATWAGVLAAVKTLRRDRKVRLEAEGMTVEAENLSASETKRLLDVVEGLYELRAAEWEQMKGRMDGQGEAKAVES